MQQQQQQGLEPYGQAWTWQPVWRVLPSIAASASAAAAASKVGEDREGDDDEEDEEVSRDDSREVTRAREAATRALAHALDTCPWLPHLCVSTLPTAVASAASSTVAAAGCAASSSQPRQTRHSRPAHPARDAIVDALRHGHPACYAWLTRAHSTHADGASSSSRVLARVFWDLPNTDAPVPAPAPAPAPPPASTSQQPSQPPQQHAVTATYASLELLTLFRSYGPRTTAPWLASSGATSPPLRITRLTIRLLTPHPHVDAWSQWFRDAFGPPPNSRSLDIAPPSAALPINLPSPFSLLHAWRHMPLASRSVLPVRFLDGRLYLCALFSHMSSSRDSVGNHRGEYCGDSADDADAAGDWGVISDSTVIEWAAWDRSSPGSSFAELAARAYPISALSRNRAAAAATATSLDDSLLAAHASRLSLDDREDSDHHHHHLSSFLGEPSSALHKASTVLDLACLARHPFPHAFARPHMLHLYGPPATGKTDFVRRWWQQRRRAHANLSLHQLARDSLLSTAPSLFAGAQSAWRRAVATQPSLVLIDDAHEWLSAALVRAESTGADGGAGAGDVLATVSFLAHCIRSLTSADRVAVIVVTHRRAHLPTLFSALCPIECRVSPPVTARQRASILHDALARYAVEVDDGTAVDAVSEASAGLVGGDLVALVKHAHHRAVLRAVHEATSSTLEVVRVTSADLWHALEHVASTSSSHRGDRAVASRGGASSAASPHSATASTVSWDDIAGLEHVKRELIDAVETCAGRTTTLLLKRNATDEKGAVVTADSTPCVSPLLAFLPVPVGLLLYGPPGTGKTLLVQALSTHLSHAFHAVDMAALTQAYMGESEKALTAVFERAILTQPCIVFFDEVQAVFGRRDQPHHQHQGGGGGGNAGGGGDSGGNAGSANSSLARKLVSQLTLELDRIKRERHRVLVVAATNVPHALDPVLLRPGRFDRAIYVGPPDEAARRIVLSRMSSEFAWDSALCARVGEIAQRTHGFTCADLNQLRIAVGYRAIERGVSSLAAIAPASDVTVQWIDMLHALRTVRPSVSPALEKKLRSWRRA